MNYIEPDGLFYERLIQILFEKKITKTKFYSELQLTRSTVQKWRKGSTPQAACLFNIASYLDVSPYYLLYGKSQLYSYITKTELNIILDKAQKYDELIEFINKQKIEKK